MATERVETPRCKATQQAIMNAGLGLFEDCPACRDLNVLCSVACHPTAPAAGKNYLLPFLRNIFSAFQVRQQILFHYFILLSVTVQFF